MHSPLVVPEVLVMAAIIDYPQVVHYALRDFGDLFPNEPQRRHFAEYLTGLFVADRKNVSSINRAFAQTTDQSCLNRFLTAADWDVTALNRRRLDELQHDPTTRYSEQGIIPIDNTLIDHDGELIPDAGWFWDHSEERYKIAQDYLFADYVCTSGKHFPLEFRRFQKEDLCAVLEVPFKDHTVLCQELIDWVDAQKIPGTFALDTYFTNAPVLNYIHDKQLEDGQPRGYVGSLKFNRKLTYRGQTLKAADLAATITPEVRKPLLQGDRQQWYFTCTLRIPAVKHKVRIVIIWNHRDDAAPRIILVSNRIQWEVSRLVRGYRHRWTGTETFHRDGKQQLGMGDCQLRDSEGQTRHMYLVMLAYSLLMRQLQQGHAYEWAFQKLTTIGEACRAILRETLRKTLIWAIEHVRDKAWNTEYVLDYLGLT
jgi:DDE superfamily endonuclease